MVTAKEAKLLTEQSKNNLKEIEEAIANKIIASCKEKSTTCWVNVPKDACDHFISLLKESGFEVSISDYNTLTNTIMIRWMNA